MRADLRHMESSHEEGLHTESPDLSSELAGFWGISTTPRWPGWEQGILFWEECHGNQAVLLEKNPSQLYLVPHRSVLWGLCRGWSSKQITSLIPPFQICCLKLLLLNFSLSWDCICKTKSWNLYQPLQQLFHLPRFFHCFIFRQRLVGILGLCNSGSFLNFIFQTPLSFIFQTPLHFIFQNPSWHP